MRLAIAALGLLLGAAAHAQTTVPAVQQVELLAPQLVGFSGSTGNFESLVSGLTAGTPVTLASVGADGIMQIVTFAPGTTMSAAEAARTLETARQALIARGVAVPNAQQLAIALMGGTLTNGATSVALPGILTGTATGTGIQVRNEAFALSPANVDAVRALLPPAMASLGAADLNQALQLAIGMLAQQGIVSPTPEQLRIALVGGTLVGASGASITLQGLLQPGVQNTSASPFFGTSNSRIIGTSNTPPTINPVVKPAPVNAAGIARPPAPAPAPLRPGARPGG